MTTQGISLVTSKASEKMTVRNARKSDSTFDSLMTDRASKADVSQKRDSKPDKALDFESAEKPDQALPLKKESPAAAKNSDTQDSGMQTDGKQQLTKETADPEVIAYQMTGMLREVLGLDMVTLQDIMKQSGMSLGEMLASFQGDGMKELLQNLVMEVHGITDKAAFLTNDQLVQELSALNERFAGILSEALQIPEEELAKADPSALTSLAEQLDDMVQSGTQTEQDAGQMADMVTDHPKQGFEVIVENAQNGRSDAQTETSAGRQEAEPALQNEGNASAANLFTEHLAEAFETSAGERTPSAGSLMPHIVDQVVNQVKIRMMPETTSMELMLHPESLGRVSLQVTAAGGATKAMLIVENQMAKEALESQMITLKETFEEQGLKVDAVEVTVSEFGLDHQERQDQQDQKNGAKRRRFRLDAGAEDSTVEGTDVQMVQAERRDVNSVVDYTA
jgi:Flagellar hook-length control protein